MNIAEYSIRHKVVSWLFTLILLVGGVVSFTRLGQLEDPEFTLKIAMVITNYAGASPRHVEEEVTLPVEKAIQSLHYVKNVTSISSNGLSQVQVEMKPRYRASQLKQIWDELRHKLTDLQGQLPPAQGTIQVENDFGDCSGLLLPIHGEGDRDEARQDHADVPTVAPLPCPLVVIPGVTTDIDLGVNPARTAKHLAPRLKKRPVVHVTLRFGIELPVVAAAEHQLQETQRHVHERVAAALRTGFKQQHRMATALRQAAGDSTSGRARANHDIVKLFGRHPGQPVH